MAMHEVTSLALERLLPRGVHTAATACKYMESMSTSSSNSHHIDQLAQLKYSTLRCRVCVSGHRRGR